jgi:GTP cyclohydrolase I
MQSQSPDKFLKWTTGSSHLKSKKNKFKRIIAEPKTYKMIANKLKGYEKIEKYDTETAAILAENYRSIIENLGENIYREGLEKTPERAAKAMMFLTHGYGLNPLEILKSALFTENHTQMIVVKDIEVYSMCEHHMLPFFGKAHIAYIPNGKIVGLSKLPRIVDAFSRRMQVQERLTDEIKNCILEALDPLGVAVVIEAQHMCMCMRGIQKQNSVTTTSSFTGAFEKNKTRREFISLISNKLS